MLFWWKSPFAPFLATAPPATRLSRAMTSSAARPLLGPGPECESSSVVVAAAFLAPRPRPPFAGAFDAAADASLDPPPPLSFAHSASTSARFLAETSMSSSTSASVLSAAPMVSMCVSRIGR